MRLLSFAGAPLYAMLLVTSATGAPTNEGMIANDHLSKLPPEVLLNCLSYFSWEERADLRLINKKLGNLLSDDQNIATLSTFKSELTINSYLDPPEARAEIEPASFEFRLWQRAHFWTWAIALGHDEVRDVLEPKHSKWTTDHYKRLTTIMCQLQVAKVCDYLTHVKGYNYSPDDNINFDQMTFAQKLRELPNPYLNWDISDPQKVWVAAPEESAPMPQ
ncbi:hypothetical protein H4R35_001543 [Dimargaris xerosporica]|nr:hypothetical protein H4R35_001543 [Dimargaris xerosporica]